jgi:hypothetical protein
MEDAIDIDDDIDQANPQEELDRYLRSPLQKISDKLAWWKVRTTIVKLCWKET